MSENDCDKALFSLTSVAKQTENFISTIDDALDKIGKKNSFTSLAPLELFLELYSELRYLPLLVLPFWFFYLLLLV